MAFNTLGTAATQVRIWNPAGARALRKRFMREEMPELDLANALYCPGGRYPACGYFLVKRGDLTAFTNLYSNAFQVVLPTIGGGSLTIKNLSIVQARCCTTGANDPNSLMLVEMTDNRGILRSRWFQFPLTAAYNLRAPAYPQLYYADTTNSGTAWTWSQMVGDIWGQTSLLGSYPGLPITPTGTPENWNFPGVPLLDALCDVLDHLGLRIAVDLTSGTTYTIVQLGATDNAFTTLQSSLVGFLQDDFRWIDSGSGRVPGTVNVMFHTRYQYYGTEETVRRDSNQWFTRGGVLPGGTHAPYYTVGEAAPAQFTGAQGVHGLWDDFTVRLDNTGTPLGADTATASTIAAERATQFYQLIYRSTLGYMNQMYAGAQQFKTGSQVDGVMWKQDMFDRYGWETNIVRGSWPLWRTVPGFSRLPRPD